MQLTDGFQLSLFGRTSWEVFHQATGLIMRPCSERSQTPTFQFLLLEHGPTPEWCEAEALTSAGGSWTPNIGQAPAWHDGSVSSSWRILEGGVLTKDQSIYPSIKERPRTSAILKEKTQGWTITPRTHRSAEQAAGSTAVPPKAPTPAGAKTTTKHFHGVVSRLFRKLVCRLWVE